MSGRDGLHVTVKIDGAHELARQFDTVKVRAGPILRAALWQAAQIIRNEAVRGIMKGPKSGRIYPRGKKVHQASKAGEYPAADTGNLAKSIQQRHTQTTLGPAVDVEASASYAEPLELKAPERGGRPFLGRAFEAKYVEALRVIEAAVAAIFPGDRRATRR